MQSVTHVWVCTVCVYLPVKVLVCLCWLACVCVCVHMCPFVCLSQHHESVELATAETSKAGLRASSFWLDRSLCCSWETRQQREKRKENRPSSSSSLYSCHLLSLAVLRPPALPASSPPSSLHCLCVPLPFFPRSFAVLSCDALPPLHPSTVASPHSSLLPPLVSAPQRTVAGTGGWQTALCEVQGSFEISAGSRRFIKKAFSMKRTVHLWGEGTGPTAQGDMDL